MNNKGMHFERLVVFGGAASIGGNTSLYCRQSLVNQLERSWILVGDKKWSCLLRCDCEVFMAYGLQ